MPQISAGILAWRRTGVEPEFLLVHPGGPYWARKDAGAWSIPKGEYEPDEDPLEAARREFEEELGAAAPEGETVDLDEVRTARARTITVDSPGINAYADGEYVCPLPVEVSAVPGALNILRP